MNLSDALRTVRGVLDLASEFTQNENTGATGEQGTGGADHQAGGKTHKGWK